MAQTTITTRIDADDKILFDNFCENIGMTASGAINVFIKTVLREKKIPFEIRHDFNAETVLALKEYEEMKNSPQNYKKYDSAEEMMDEVLGE